MINQVASVLDLPIDLAFSVCRTIGSARTRPRGICSSPSPAQPVSSSAHSQKIDVLVQISMNKSRPSSLSQQSQSLLVTHGLPRDKFLGKHIHSPKEGQLEKKS